MYKVFGIKNTIVWDAETDSPLIRFTDGVAETDDTTIANKLKKEKTAAQSKTEKSYT